MVFLELFPLGLDLGSTQFFQELESIGVSATFNGIPLIFTILIIKNRYTLG
jgi:hypothetical protein